MQETTSPTKKSRRIFAVTAVLMALFLLVSRGLTLTYNMNYHPDERCFYTSTNSLMRSLLDPSEPFTEFKEYPEGAYLFHLPFHLIGNLCNAEYDQRLWGRISAVCYFTLAALVGLAIVHRYLGKTKIAMLLYAAIMCFSVFFIEQSRYGVGDTISLFLLLLVIYLTAASLSASSKHASVLLLIGACAASGALGAVKYPLLMFVLIPVLSFWQRSKQPKKLLRAIGLLLVCGIFFLLFSPKGMRDPLYFVRVLLVEASAYVTTGTQYEAGGLLNHIAQLLIYALFYADLPLSLLFVAGLFLSYARKLRSAKKNGTAWSDTDPLIFLFEAIIPLLCTVFFLYNLFAKLMVFRTYTSYFGIAALYCAAALSKLWHAKKWQRILAAVLCACMIVRGAALIAVLSQGDVLDADMSAMIEAAVDENWEKTTTVQPYCVLPTAIADMPMEKIYPPTAGGKVQLDEYLLSPGELCITGAYPFCYAAPYLFPVGAEIDARIASWEAFTKNNSAYYVGRIYPDAYYYLFGGWVHSDTLGAFTMPCNYIYYRSK